MRAVMNGVMYILSTGCQWRYLPRRLRCSIPPSYAPMSRRRAQGQDDQALGRSRGGFSTKIHLKVDLGGLPLSFHLTGGEASDSRNFEILLDLGPDINPRAALGDKGYDSKSNREAARLAIAQTHRAAL
jgi:transposase